MPPPGTRVVVRHRRDGTDGGPPLSDALGELVRVGEDVLVVRTRRGEVTVPRDAVVALRTVPPPPRPRSEVAAVDVETVQRVAGASWPAPEWTALGDWTLRAAGGWTRRANSVLALGGPGRSWREALATAGGWYRARGLPLLVQVPEGEPSALLQPALRRSGLESFGRTEVLVGDLASLPLGGPPEPSVRWVSGPDPSWLAVHAHQRAPRPGVSEAVLGAPGAHLGSVGDRGEDGVVRLWAAADPAERGWAVLSCLWVAPAARGRGLGRTLTVTAARRALELGCHGLALQVVPGNEAALRTYAGLGLTRHHGYEYWGPLGATGPRP